MEVTVKTIWGDNKFSILDKYIKKALFLKEDLDVVLKGAVYKITNEKLKELRPRDKKFPDKFKPGKFYQLYDFSIDKGEYGKTKITPLQSTQRKTN
jgi:hypothetical protein